MTRHELKSSDPEFWQKHHENMLIDARAIAAQYTISEIAKQISNEAPKHNGKAAKAYVHWSYIYAIRIRLGEIS